MAESRVVTRVCNIVCKTSASKVCGCICGGTNHGIAVDRKQKLVGMGLYDCIFCLKPLEHREVAEGESRWVHIDDEGRVRTVKHDAIPGVDRFAQPVAV